MILPIISYGTSVLKRKAQEVDLSNPNLKKNIEDMWETMYAASGVGIAAPQVGLSLRLFLVDGTPFYEDDQIEDNYKYQLKNLKKVFINPKIGETGREWCFNEGRRNAVHSDAVGSQFHCERLGEAFEAPFRRAIDRPQWSADMAHLR